MAEPEVLFHRVAILDGCLSIVEHNRSDDLDNMFQTLNLAVKKSSRL